MQNAARALFDGPNTAHFATLMPDGAPHSVPLWVGRDGDRLAILTIPGSRKDLNVRDDARVSLSVTASDNPAAMASVRGRVVERVEGERAWEIIDGIAHKYIGAPYPERSDRIVLLIEVDASFAHDYSA